MTKIKVEELGCFNEVASVIGVAKANRELFRVANNKQSIDDRSNLAFAFSYSLSPQGLDFWCDINDAISRS